MPAKDIFHDAVKNALIKDGWTITYDPLRLTYGDEEMYADLGAERLLAAAKGAQRIAMEIKSFLGASRVTDLERALGQYVLYHDVLEEIEPERVLYLAVSERVVQQIFVEPLGQMLMRKQRARLMVFDPIREVIVQWIP